MRNLGVKQKTGTVTGSRSVKRSYFEEELASAKQLAAQEAESGQA